VRDPDLRPYRFEQPSLDDLRAEVDRVVRAKPLLVPLERFIIHRVDRAPLAKRNLRHNSMRLGLGERRLKEGDNGE
jgi:hypothetical protein